MSSNAMKETQAEKSHGQAETRTSTVDYRSPAGQGQGQELRNVEVIHQPSPQPKSNTSGGVLASAAASVAGTLQSAKEAIAGTTTTTSSSSSEQSR